MSALFGGNFVLQDEVVLGLSLPHLGDFGYWPYDTIDSFLYWKRQERETSFAERGAAWGNLHIRPSDA